MSDAVAARRKSERNTKSRREAARFHPSASTHARSGDCDSKFNLSCNLPCFVLLLATDIASRNSSVFKRVRKRLRFAGKQLSRLHQLDRYRDRNRTSHLIADVQYLIDDVSTDVLESSASRGGIKISHTSPALSSDWTLFANFYRTRRDRAFISAIIRGNIEPREWSRVDVTLMRLRSKDVAATSLI